MTTVTLELPDELAARLAPVRDRLPELLTIALELFPTGMPSTVLTGEPLPKAFEEVIDFLSSGPSPEHIVAFKMSPSTQARLEELLDKNREEGLTDNEAAELEVYEQINHLLLLLKARARSMRSSSN